MRTVRRRRLQKKTDYKSRLSLLGSGKKRLVVRKTNRYVISQIVESHIAQDKVLFGISSRDLLSHGWPEKLKGSLKSLPASYLTGYLLGKMAKERKISEVILDLGMHRNVHKSRIYAVVKGIVDAGIKIPHKSEILPETEKIEGNETFSSIIKSIKK
nr:50S ribosomal protein L18P [uncultured archaeon]